MLRKYCAIIIIFIPMIWVLLDYNNSILVAANPIEINAQDQNLDGSMDPGVMGKSGGGGGDEFHLKNSGKARIKRQFSLQHALDEEDPKLPADVTISEGEVGRMYEDLVASEYVREKCADMQL